MKNRFSVALAFITVFGLCSNTSAEDSFFGTAFENTKAYLKPDVYRIEVGNGRLKLNNPRGFDVSSEAYRTGSSETDFFGEFAQSVTLFGETGIGWDNKRKRVWSIHYDSDDFEGLEVTSLMFGGGLAFGPAQPFSGGVRFAGGLGAGITHSNTYFDIALHPSVEAWLSGGVQFGRFVMGLTIRERASLGAKLDERTATPRTTTRTFNIGWVF